MTFCDTFASKILAQESAAVPKKTPLYDDHVQLNALIVDFAGWLMPLHYGSQMNEHYAVRNHVGVFDVSHMGVVEITGNNTIAFLRYVLANDVAKLKNNGDALYSCMLNETGGVLDDLIVYRLSDTRCRLVINASCRDKDMEWLKQHAEKYGLTVHLRDDVCLLALQGPRAIAMLEMLFDKTTHDKVATLKLFQFCTLHHTDIMITRTGYTGESGVEIMLPIDAALQLWKKMIEQGVQPCGLGARDTLRLEAGYNLFGADMTEQTSPLISNLSWTVSFKDEARRFIGRDALEKEKNTDMTQQLVGLVLEAKGVLRNHQKVKINGDGTGEITSGSFSPTLHQSIALARIPITQAETVLVERRGEWLPARIVKVPFYKKDAV